MSKHAHDNPDQLRREHDRDRWLAAGGSQDPPCALPTCQVPLSGHHWRGQEAGHPFEWPEAELPVRGSEGHEIVRSQLARHGADRYPTMTAQMLKLVSEVGELADAMLKSQDPRTSHGGRPEGMRHVRAEFADVALSLYALGDKLGLDVIGEMRALVAADERRFTRVMDYQDEQMRLAGQLVRHVEDGGVPGAVLKPTAPLGAVTYSDLGCIGPMPCAEDAPHEPHAWEAGRGPLGPLVYRCAGGSRL